MSHLSESEIQGLKNKAKNLRIDIIKMITKANSGHTGGSLSVIDLLTLLFFKEMKVNPAQPQDKERDRFVLSKGHAAPALYAVLADKGYFPKEELSHLRQAGHILQGHPDMKHIPGVDMTTGSLGDGELEEGQVWEAAMYAGNYKLDNLTAFVDNNGLQIDGPITKVMSPLPIADKFKAFGWYVLSVNGHDMAELHDAIEKAKATKGKPTMIIMKTVKGKGIPEIENQVGWHGKAPSEEECERFIKVLEAE